MSAIEILMIYTSLPTENKPFPYIFISGVPNQHVQLPTVHGGPIVLLDLNIYPFGKTMQFQFSEVLKKPDDQDLFILFIACYIVNCQTVCV